MSVEVNPVGRRCGAQNGGLSCVYCYLPLDPRVNDPLPAVDHAAVQKAVLASGSGTKDFSLFGGEPLLAAREDLEKLWAFGLEKFGKNGVQTSGRPLTDELLVLVKKYKVNVGFSIDGPEELNDSRWAGSTEATREATARSIGWLERCIRERINSPSLIVTLHRKNASTAKLPKLLDWLRHLKSIGLQSAELHLLEHDGPVRWLALSPEENAQALRAVLGLGTTGPRMTLFNDIIALLRGKDAWKWRDGTPGGVKCVWTACDPWTTTSVHGIQADGSRSLCQRVNKDGVTWHPIRPGAHVRQLGLRVTPQEEGGCKGCRFFVACKGQCPGTAIDGDWRKRTRDCRTWFALFEHFERALVELGETPVSLSPDLPKIEEIMARAWAAGENIRVQGALERLRNPGAAPSAKNGDYADHTDHGDHDDLSMVLERAQGGEAVND